MSRNVTDPPRLRGPGRREEVAARQARALELRKAGANLRQVAEATGVSAMQAHRDIKRALAAVVAKRDGDAEELVAMELARLDSIQLSMTQLLRDGSELAKTRAGSVLVRVSDSRRRLLGIDAAQRFELAPVVVENRLETLTTDQILARLEAAARVVRAASEQPVIEPPASPPIDPATAYAEELKRRGSATAAG